MVGIEAYPYYQLKDNWEIHLKDVEELKKGKSPRFYDAMVHPAKQYVKPFQIFGNLYYVGNRMVCAHLVDTGDGLLVFDSVAAGQDALLINSIYELGFDPRDIKWVVHAHGHCDHIGAANLLKEMYGCKLYLSEPDARAFREFPAKSFIQGTGAPYYDLFTPDVEINDGDQITFGNTTIRFVMVPGHTEGTLACFFPVTDGKKTMQVGYFGGYGLITIDKRYLEEIGDTEYKMQQTFINSLMKVKDEPVDIFIGNHPMDNDTLEKNEYMLNHPGENPFIDDKAFNKKMSDHIKLIEEFIANGGIMEPLMLM